MARPLDLRQQVEEDFRAGNWGLARQHLAQLWRREPTMRVSRYVLGCRPRLLDRVALATCRLAILRSFTVEPLVTLLKAGALVVGIDLDVQLGGFNTYAQEILDPTSGLYRSRPDAVLLAVLTRDMGPELADAKASPQAVASISARFEDLVTAFRANSNAPLVIQGLEEPLIEGVRGGVTEKSAVGLVNARLGALVRSHPAIHLLDYQALVARHDVTTWNDERSWATSRVPLANQSLIHVARAWLRFVHAIAGRLCKVLITDLDNTLWGGVIGEDGPYGISCAAQGPGESFHAVQMVMLELRERGVLLAACSQNDPEEAMAAFELNPGMALRPHHFSAMRINWQEKAANIRSIAQQLDIGMDAVAFVDDDPVQLERVRAELPDVHVIELPDAPDRYADAIREDPVFTRLALSREDHERPRYYAEQQARLQVQQRVPSLEDFYRSLQQEVAIAPLLAGNAERAAQLTQKTNQFNLTTKRYTTPQVLDLATRPGWRVFTLTVSDRFGDSGLTGLAITHEHDGTCEIDTFLLSCRIIGRTVETALLAFLVERARGLGLALVRGWFVPTSRNSIVKDFYRRHGFESGDSRDDATEWVIDPAAARLACPTWIRLAVAEGALA